MNDEETDDRHEKHDSPDNQRPEPGRAVEEIGEPSGETLEKKDRGGGQPGEGDGRRHGREHEPEDEASRHRFRRIDSRGHVVRRILAQLREILAYLTERARRIGDHLRPPGAIDSSRSFSVAIHPVSAPDL